MTGRAKRLTLILGVTALAAAVAGAVFVPELAAAPKPKTDFVITISGSTGDWIADSRRWRGQGAITGHGGQIRDDSLGLTLFSPEPGEYYTSRMLIEGAYGEPFTIIEATGLYAHAQGATGTSTYDVQWRYQKPIGFWYMEVTHVLTGSVVP